MAGLTESNPSKQPKGQVVSAAEIVKAIEKLGPIHKGKT